MRARDDSTLFFSVLASTTPAVACLYVLPYLVTAAVEGLGADPVRAGFGTTLEVLAMAASSLGLASRVSRMELRRVALGGVAITLAGNLGSVAAAAWPACVALRVVAGVGAGIALAAGQAAGARSLAPDRLFARVVFWRATIFAILLPAFPLALAAWGHRGVYAATGTVTLVCLAGCARMPRAGASAAAAGMIPAGFVVSAAVLAATFLFATGDAALWSFSERLGLAAGVASGHMGTVLALSVAAGLCGSASAARLAIHGPRPVHVFAACVVTAAAALAVANAHGTAAFTLAIGLYGGAVFFMLPYLFGTAARWDTSGRLAAAAGGALLLGTAVGPSLGGVLVERWGTPAVGSAAAACSALTALLLYAGTRSRRVGAAATEIATLAKVAPPASHR